MSLASLIDHCIYYGGYWSSFWTYSLGWSFRATGRHNLPVKGPVLLVSNHTSHFDPWLIGLGATRPLTYLARATLFKNPYFARFIRAYGAMPIDRDYGKEGLENVIKTLELGKAVVMFPEGTRSETGEMQPLKPGVALLAKRLEATIVPCAIAGSFESWPRHQKFPRWSPLLLPDNGCSIAVAFGEPRPPGFYRKMKREEILADMEAGIRKAYAEAQNIRRK